MSNDDDNGDRDEVDRDEDDDEHGGLLLPPLVAPFVPPSPHIEPLAQPLTQPPTTPLSTTPQHLQPQQPTPPQHLSPQQPAPPQHLQAQQPAAAQHLQAQQPAAAQHAQPQQLAPQHVPAQPEHAATTSQHTARATERGRRIARPKLRAAIGAGAVAVVAVVAVVIVATRGEDKAAACGSSTGTAPPTSDGWTPVTGDVVVDQACAVQGLAGYWDGDWGQIVIRVDDDGTAVAAYDHDAGLIVGTVSDGILSGTWCEAPSYAGNSDAGLVEMRVVERDGVPTIDGRWLYGNDTSVPWSDNWDVTGKGGDAPEDLSARLDTAVETCIGPG